MLLSLVTACGNNEASENPNQPAEGTQTEEPSLDYPKKTIQLINPYSAGGGTDNVVRQLAAVLEKNLGVSVVVTNKTGGSGAVGTAEGAAANPDGYTIVVNDKAIIGSYYMGVSQVKYDELDVVCSLDSAQHILVVNASSPYQTVSDLVDAAKAAPDTMTIGVSGLGGMSHLSAEYFLAASEAPIKVVGFDGAADSKAALAGNQITCAMMQIAEAMPLVLSNDLRILGLAEEERSDYIPDVPTFKEQGIDCVLNQNRFIWAPKGTPAEIVDFLSNAIKDAMESEEFLAYMNNNYGTPNWMNPADAKAELDKQDAILKELIENAGLAA